MLNIVIFGAPGTGKGTQSKRIIEKYGLYHISTGDLLRKEIQDRTPLGAIADQYINQGQLVPDQVIIEMMADILRHAPHNKGYIFDGFPRTIAQAEALDQLLQQQHTPITAVLTLQADDATIFQRLLHRAQLEKRADDTPQTIQNRLNIYRQQTEPLKAYYQNSGKLHPVPQGDTIDQVFEHVTRILDTLPR
jgi:adenylate kinase